jgi:hypothetical protein
MPLSSLPVEGIGLDVIPAPKWEPRIMRVTEAVENNGPLQFARGMMQAINRRKPDEFAPRPQSDR